MKNIWYTKSKKSINRKLLISIVILIIILTWAVVGINIASKANKEQQVAELEASINKAINLCYAIEGIYPPSIDYLEDNYGVRIDNDRYIIHYEIFASNIKPELAIFNK